MTQAMTLEHWLLIASNGLAPDSAEQVRAEITEHYESALASGASPEAAVASLGDAKRANRQYRGVYLTRKEAVAASALANPKESLKQAIKSDLCYLALMGWFVSRIGFSLPMLLWIFWLETPLNAFYPPNTRERCRNHLWIFIGRILFFFLFIAYESPTVGLIWLGLGVPLVMISYEYRRWKVIRKLAHSPEGIPVVPVVPAPYLTDCESRALKSLRPLRAFHYVGIALVSLDVALYAFLSPLVGRTLLFTLSFAYFVPAFVSIKTPRRGRRFRRIKWYLFALTAVVPPCYVIFVNLEPDLRRIDTFVWASISAYLILLAHVVREPVLIRLRNKLPFYQWPERLHQ